MSSTSLLYGISSAFGGMLALGVQLTLLIVTLTTVQQRRPDVVALLLAATALDLFATVGAYVVPFALTRLLTLSEAYVQAQAINGAVFAICHAIAKLILIFGIIRLCRPAEAERA